MNETINKAKNENINQEEIINKKMSEKNTVKNNETEKSTIKNEEKINKNKLEKIKQILKSNLIFFVGTLLLVYKEILLNCSLGIEITVVNVLFAILVSMLIMSPTINNRKKFSYIYLNIVYMIVTLVIYANHLYYSYSTNLLSLYQIENIKYANEIGTGLTGIISIQSIILFWFDNVILAVLSVIGYKKLKNIKYENKIQKKSLILIIFIINVLAVQFFVNGIYKERIYSKTSIIKDLSIYYYHYEDIKDYFSNTFVKEDVDLEKLDKIYKENLLDKVSETEYTGIAKDSNVIILQMESLNEYIIGKKVNGKEITPNLNKFFAENIYCTNMYNQGLGTTADSEFEMENSMYPLENGYVFQKYYGNTWFDIYSSLKNTGYYTSFMHPNDSTYWNRDAVYHTGYNIDEYNDLNSFPGIERAGPFYSDEGFFEKAVEIMNSYDKKFCTTLVSITTHTAFGLEGVSNVEEKTTITQEDVKNFDEWIMRNYIISCNFADYAFGKFIERLEETGLINNTLLVVYGDHGAGITCENDIKKLYEENGMQYTEFEKYMKDVHVPCGIKIPNVKDDRNIDTAVSKIDIKPTILDLLGEEDKFSLGNTIFSNKDYSFIKNLGYVTQNYYCINGKYYDRITLKEIEENEQMANLLKKMKDEIYLSDTIIKNDLLNINNVTH